MSADSPVVGRHGIVRAVSTRSRKKREARYIIPILRTLLSRKDRVAILDVGGTRQYWQSLLERLGAEARRLHVTVLNVDPQFLSADDAQLTFVQGNACAMPEYADAQFDLVVSNSVIEHVEEPVGSVSWTAVRKYAAEVRRVGVSLYVQAPAFWFPFEPHYKLPLFHWLPRPMQATVMRRLAIRGRSKARDVDEAYRRLDRTPRLPTYADMRFLFPDCAILRERFLGIFVKSLIAIRSEAGS